MILGYHAVDSEWGSQLAVKEATFVRQLEFLQSAGFVGLTFSDAERRRLTGTLPSRSVVITFDDGYLSTLTAARLMRPFGFVGTVFVVTDFVESGRPLSWRGLDDERVDIEQHLASLRWTDAEELLSLGWEVGSHTRDHRLLTSLDDATLGEQLASSRAAISARLGSCTSIAYPYGIADGRVAAAAAAAGYDFGCTLTFPHSVDTPLLRPRVGIGERDVGLRLRLQLCGAGLGVRRSVAVRVARKLRRRRPWIPSGE